MEAVKTAPGRIAEVFIVFLKLGLTSFGGPIAHLGYFREEFVNRRKWLSDEAYADIVALCQFLPGPASSQVGFTIGIFRGGGLLGGIAAWAAFTFPSALLLFAFAYGSASFAGPTGQGIIHGLKLVAVAVVAQAIWGMAHTLTPDKTRIAIALSAIAAAVFLNNAIGQIGAIAGGALLGLALCRTANVPNTHHLNFPVSRRTAVPALVLFAALFVIPSLVYGYFHCQTLLQFDAFYRSGALVFGGGHVVLPLLETAVVGAGWVSHEAFLAGYGAAQAVPGPLFTFAVYLGAIASPPPNGLAGAIIAVIALFLPGLLLVYGTLPFWEGLRRRPQAQAAMRGANAAVVGILATAFYSPVWTSAVLTPLDFLLAAAGFLFLTVWKTPPWIVVITLATVGAIASMF
ncbi:chromate efflux transporter [Phyllobacterium myrsinacearum]|uniref:Chromate transporter n=1 Tax=Phyllobacterium myrsinacearum TaxID=28101 RepID=A0A839EQU0_9HYPH|nr:chromate efflux transporter [Phyllobacterium myrsinacearum]MBA8878980.1 chromate transporter [Phyllobacterium myrsinacearum]